MKVLEKGSGNQVTCPCCKSLLEFEPGDVQRAPAGFDHDEGERLYSYSVSCESCRNQVPVRALTSAMRARVDAVQEERNRRVDEDI